MASNALKQPIVRQSLHEELVGLVRELIVDGDLPPGVKIPEKELCERFGVSRTPLREALKVLASEGLVTLTPNRGASASLITIEDLEEVFPVMGALEALAGELACQHMTAREIASVRSLHNRMIEHYRQEQLKPYFQLNQNIHEAILAGSRNNSLIVMYRSLAGRVRRARYFANMSRKRWAQAAAEHEEIISALEARDGAQLADILKRHLQNKFETVSQQLMEMAESVQKPNRASR
ncbi:GntR family transcriptional regulator [Pelagibius sp. Alg239-R121]|uniref:GntR family transcriptional regulator n=1 Tax=Pelagibius sp. Alg239-R121 TaxID=2993448 RepID=UPI0024A697DE|nr:GntR family transcriptional regulator [Pelagibius sp. Alg239-R121]